MSLVRCVSSLLLGVVGIAQAGEAWRLVYEDAAMRVAVDMASIQRESQGVTIRERHRLAIAEIDGESLRRVVEIQYRRAVDCENQRLAVLSRAMFSDHDALVHYEAARPANLQWTTPGNERESRLYEWVCDIRP
jgi:hypothetical protein